MATIIMNASLNAGNKIELKNGATRPTLLVINKTGKDVESGVPFKGSIGFLKKGNHNFIFLNEEKTSSEKTIGIHVRDGYGVDLSNVAETNVLFEAYSQGGYGNSESDIIAFQIPKDGCYIIENSYKNRREPSYIRYTHTGCEYVRAEVATLDLYCDGVEMVD